MKQKHRCHSSLPYPSKREAVCLCLASPPWIKAKPADSTVLQSLPLFLSFSVPPFCSPSLMQSSWSPTSLSLFPLQRERCVTANSDIIFVRKPSVLSVQEQHKGFFNSYGEGQHSNPHSRHSERKNRKGEALPALVQVCTAIHVIPVRHRSSFPPFFDLSLDIDNLINNQKTSPQT